jgi:DNA-binding HxlR family transcriptional regulator
MKLAKRKWNCKRKAKDMIGGMPSEPVPPPRSYAQLCGVATALDVIGDRWTPLVLRDLLLGPLRFGDLADGLPGIGTNTLAARLKHLESAGVVRRRLLPLPDRGTSYELTEYGRELEPILMALGRWGTRSMGRLPAKVATRSRWLVAAMLAFHDEERQIDRPTTWELRLSDGPFTIRAEAAILAAASGAPDACDLVLTTEDETMHRLLTRQLAPEDAIARHAVTLDGDETALRRLLELFAFPVLG